MLGAKCLVRLVLGAHPAPAPSTQHPAPSTRRAPLAVLAALFLAACSRTPAPTLTVVGSPTPTAVEVRGLPAADLANLSHEFGDSHPLWAEIFRVELEGSSGPPMAGRYQVDRGSVRFTPWFGFDPGRSFKATLDPSKIGNPNAPEPWRAKVVVLRFDIPARIVDRATIVRQVYPSGPTLPENMLRFYIEFSAPMGRGSALEHIRLVEETGKEVVEPFLPVEAEFWSRDRTRFTLFFDPGRVKRGIKPNRDMGRALVLGQKYTLVIDEHWRDGREQPLKSGYRHEFAVGPAIEKALNQAEWKITPPRLGTRDPLIVTFPWALDHALMQRSLGVSHGPADVSGQGMVSDSETRWSFTPSDPWTAGEYSVVALTLLEDPAGNRLGRAFEVTTPVTDSQPSVWISFKLK